MNIDREQLAWAAGLWCGEGSVYTRGRSLVANMGQKDPEVLHRLCAVVQLGRVSGPYGPYPASNNNCAMYQYRVTSHRDVQQLACLLWPWMSTAKKEQFHRALKKSLAIVAMPQRRTRNARRAAGLDPAPPGRSPDSVARYRAKEREWRRSPEGLAYRRAAYARLKERRAKASS